MWLVVAVLLNSCREKDPEPRLRNAIRITDQLYASFEVLDMDGQPRTSFREGEDFQLSFKLRNVSSDTLDTGPAFSIPSLSRLFYVDNRNFFSVVKKVEDGSGQIMGRPIDAPAMSGSFSPGGVIILPKTTVTYQVGWKTQINALYPMPVYDPVPGTENRWYLQRFAVRTGLENKIESLPKGAYYSSFIIDIFYKRVQFRVDFTIN